MTILQGMIPAIITPFKEDQSLNEESLRSMVRNLIDCGVHGLFCLGSNGEFFSLTTKEKLRIATILVEEAAGKVPVYAGTGGTSTAEVIQLNKEMKQVGVTAVSVITPYFPKLTEKELIHHYELVANQSDIPIILYNIPAQTGNNLSAGAVRKLAQHPNIIGIKDSSGSYDTILQYIEAAEQASFSVLAGTDSLILATLMAGGTGAVSATANFLPEAAVGIYESWKASEFEKAELQQRKLRKIRSVFKLGSIPAALKESLNQIGVAAGPTRFPVLPVTESAKTEIQAMVKAYREEGVLQTERALSAEK